MTLSRVYGFGKFMTHFDRDVTCRYVQRFDGLALRPRAVSRLRHCA